MVVLCCILRGSLWVLKVIYRIGALQFSREELPVLEYIKGAYLNRFSKKFGPGLHDTVSISYRIRFIGFIPLSEHFHLKTQKRYEVYEIGAFSGKQKANPI